MIEKAESLVRRMRWKAFFFLNPQCKPDSKETYGFKTNKPAPYIAELKPFEDDLYNMIANIKTIPVKSDFQSNLNDDIKNIKQAPEVFVPADKSRNYYKVDKNQHSKILNSSVTKSYKKAPKGTYDKINQEAKDIASDLDLDDRIECMAEKTAFISLKDHKQNFANNPTCRLLNPTKSEIGHISKQKLDKIISRVKHLTNVNQWKSTHRCYKLVQINQRQT